MDRTIIDALFMLSRCLTFPDRDFTDQVVDGTVCAQLADTFATLADNDVIAADAWEAIAADLVALADGYRTTDVDDGFHQLRTEYTNLFLGMPHPVVSPYETIHRGALDDRPVLLMVDDVATQVAAAYRQAGIKTNNHHEPVDHIALELEFLGFLATEDEQQSFDAFCTDHLFVWVGHFCEGVERFARPASFYAIVGRLLGCLTDGLRRN